MVCDLAAWAATGKMVVGGALSGTLHGAGDGWPRGYSCFRIFMNSLFKRDWTCHVRPGSFLGHCILLLYLNLVTVSILSNGSLLGVEHITRFWYSVPWLQEPLPRGRRPGGVHGMWGARRGEGGVAAKILRCHKIIPTSRAVNANSREV